MAVEVYGGHFLSGAPVMDYTIKINNVGIELTAEDFKALSEGIGAALSQDYDRIVETKAKYERNIKKLQELRKDILNIFWEGEEGDDWFLRKPLKEINEDELTEVLEKYNKFLGFE